MTTFCCLICYTQLEGQFSSTLCNPLGPLVGKQRGVESLTIQYNTVQYEQPSLHLITSKTFFVHVMSV